MTTRAGLIALATGLMGFVAGWLLAAPSEAPPAASSFAPAMEAQGSSREVSLAPSQPGGISLDDVRRVVREELAAAGRQPAVVGAGQTEAADTEPTPAQAAALARASMVLDGALSRRQFTESDVDALRAEFHQLSPGQQAEIMQRYAVAVNQGRIVPTTDRLPF
jgi:hypothetical protein